MFKIKHGLVDTHTSLKVYFKNENVSYIYIYEATTFRNENQFKDIGLDV